MFLLVLWGGTAIADAFVFYCMLVCLLAFLLCGETLGGTLEGEVRGWLPVPIPKCKEP